MNLKFLKKTFLVQLCHNSGHCYMKAVWTHKFHFKLMAMKSISKLSVFWDSIRKERRRVLHNTSKKNVAVTLRTKGQFQLILLIL